MLRSSAAAFGAKKVIPLSVRKPFEIHTAGKKNLPEIPPQVTVDTDDILRWYTDMVRIRRVEMLCDQSYKLKRIRGFCHLCIGQEAIPVGVESILTREDAIVTAYRDHGWHMVRGGTAFEVFTEQFGKQEGCSKGKGGSMHMYNTKNNFFGGNGIVGAQVPIGVGLAWKHSYVNGKESPQNVSIALYGDGAANQGQIFEVFNMAALYKIPCIFACENNHFGMGTAKFRASAQPQFFRRCDYIPGIFLDGMDIFAVREATRAAREWCIKGNGPIILEFDSYRYMGHSMSDPDSTYRTPQDIAAVQSERDCISMLRGKILAEGISKEEDLKNMEKEVRKEVEAVYATALKARDTKIEELHTDLYTGEQYPVRSCQGTVFL